MLYFPAPKICVWGFDRNIIKGLLPTPHHTQGNAHRLRPRLNVSSDGCLKLFALLLLFSPELPTYLFFGFHFLVSSAALILTLTSMELPLSNSEFVRRSLWHVSAYPRDLWQLFSSTEILSSDLSSSVQHSFWENTA